MKFIQVNNDLVNLANVTNIQLNGMEITIFYTSGAGTRIMHDDIKQAMIRFSQIKLEIDGQPQTIKKAVKK
jgi:hypothetical protein